MEPTLRRRKKKRKSQKRESEELINPPTPAEMTCMIIRKIQVLFRRSLSIKLGKSLETSYHPGIDDPDSEKKRYGMTAERIVPIDREVLESFNDPGLKLDFLILKNQLIHDDYENFKQYTPDHYATASYRRLNRKRKKLMRSRKS